MQLERHERVKQIFLGALERTGNDRATYLERECGADKGLRPEVEDLLAHHHDGTVIPTGFRFSRADGNESSWVLKRFSSVFDILSFLSATRSRRLLALVAAIASVVVLGVWARTRARQMLFGQTASALRAVLDSNAKALSAGLADWQAQVQAAVELPAVAGALNRLLTTDRPNAWPDVVSQIQPLLAGRRFHSYFVLNRAGELIATSTGPRLGSVTASGMAIVARVNRGKTVVSFPDVRPDFGESGDQEMVWPRITILTPVRGPEGRIAGTFALVLPMGEVAERLLRGRPFETGETYLFREDGLLLSPMKYQADLARWRLLQPGGDRVGPVFYLRDPGRNLYDAAGPVPGEDPVTWPLTTVVRVAASKQKISNSEQTGDILTPYRDYRGVRVVSAWRWYPEFKVGLTTEVDEAEIANAIRFIDWPIALFTVLLGGAGCWTILSSTLLAGLRRRTLAVEALGQYTLTEKIGEGGIGEVFVARHALLRRPAAVKLLRRDRLDPAFLAQFEREAQAASRLRHPNTVQIYDYGQTPEGTPYVVMEYVSGLDLGQWVRRYGSVPPARAVHIVKQVSAALNEAHQLKLIHRDIKPANVMLCSLAGEYDFVKLLDFGLAKDISDPGDETVPSARLATPFYTAPERLGSGAPVDQRSDIYSAGVLLYFLVCGTTPFETGANWVEATLAGDPIPPSRRVDVPAALEELILACISRIPEGRPESARELLARLEQLDGIPRWTAEEAQVAWRAAIDEHAANPRQ